MNDQTNLPAEVAAPAPPAIAKANLSPGGAIAALVPQSLEDAFRLSKALAASGDMIPKHFQGKPDMVMAAVIRGMEIGLAPMQALSNIAVINGRASIWGDALPALIQRAGHTLDCILEGEGDNMRAVATLTRGDTGKEIVRTFSVAEAKKAGLWGKQGPWQAYPTRMLQMRARSFAVRDGAADAMMGLQVAEEVSDYAKDVTPSDRPMSAFQTKVAAARGTLPPTEPAREEAAPEEPAPADVVDAEIVGADTIGTTDGVDLEGAFPGSDEFTEGAKAFAEGRPLSSCPYDMASDKGKAIDWMGGFTQAKKAGA